MFTGIVQSIGTLAAIDERNGDLRLGIRSGKLPLEDVHLGDSIAVSGVCLTVVQLPGDGFVADVSRETLANTTLGGLKPDAKVNLEKALTLATPLGGHLVSGHVDGIGRITERRREARSIRFGIEAPAQLCRYIAPKGSICIDGISLTVTAVSGPTFELNIVPHTLAETTLAEAGPGTAVNIEVDLIARYLERLLLGDKTEATGSDKGVSLDLLKNAGFLERG